MGPFLDLVDDIRVIRIDLHFAAIKIVLDKDRGTGVLGAVDLRPIVGAAVQHRPNATTGGIGDGGVGRIGGKTVDLGIGQVAVERRPEVGGRIVLEDAAVRSDDEIVVGRHGHRQDPRHRRVAIRHCGEKNPGGAARREHLHVSMTGGVGAADVKGAVGGIDRQGQGIVALRVHGVVGNGGSQRRPRLPTVGRRLHRVETVITEGSEGRSGIANVRRRGVECRVRGNQGDLDVPLRVRCGEFAGSLVVGDERRDWAATAATTATTGVAADIPVRRVARIIRGKRISQLVERHRHSQKD